MQCIFVESDVKYFFQSEKGKKVIKYTGMIGGPIVAAAGAVGLTAYIIHHKRKQNDPINLFENATDRDIWH